MSQNYPKETIMYTINQEQAELTKLAGCQNWQEVKDWFTGMTTDEIEAEANRCWPHETDNRQFAGRVYNAIQS